MFSHLITVPYLLNERNVIISNDQWRIAVNLNLSTCHEILSTVKTDLVAVEEQRKEFRLTSELKQNDLFAKTLEINFRNFMRFYPDQIRD
jgi:CYTH domain-containing protein